MGILKDSSDVGLVWSCISVQTCKEQWCMMYETPPNQFLPKNWQNLKNKSILSDSIEKGCMKDWIHLSSLSQICTDEYI